MSDPQLATVSSAGPIASPSGQTLPRSGRQAGIRAGVGAVLFTAGVLCQVFQYGGLGGEGFPSGAPVESALNLCMTIDLCGAGITLWISALFALRASRRPTRGLVSPLAIAGAALVGIALLAFLMSVPGWITVLNATEPTPAGTSRICCGPGGLILSGTRGRFDQLVGSLFFAGAPWAVGIVFATNALRRPDALSRSIAAVAIAIGVLLAVPAVAAAALYGAGLTD